MLAYRHWFIVPVMVIMLPSGISEAASGSAGSPSPAEVIVEHAEILVTPGAESVMEGFLVIWNGSSRSVMIKDVRSDSFREVKLVRTERTGSETAAVVQENFSIPAHSELLMRPGGVYLSIDSGGMTIGAGDRVDLEILYADGGSEVVAAEVRAEETALEDHHHGMQ